ncbi:MAG: RsbRD N-terminal domain-containing protein, partial [Verrucomicrobiota bacterium]
MTPRPSPEQQIVGCSLSNYLADRRHQIISEWMASVLSNPAVPAADNLTETQLKGKPLTSAHGVAGESALG